MLYLSVLIDSFFCSYKGLTLKTSALEFLYSYNEQSFAPSSFPWITTVKLSVTRFSWCTEYIRKNLVTDFYISEFRDQTKMINPHYSYNEQSFAPSSFPWITTVKLSVTRFSWCTEYIRKNLVTDFYISEFRDQTKMINPH